MLELAGGCCGYASVFRYELMIMYQIELAQCDREIEEALKIISYQEERVARWRERASFLSLKARNATITIRKTI